MSKEIELTELNTATVLKIMAKDSIDTLFFDNNGKEYLRIGADNIPADVYEKFTNWCMQLPPLHDAEITRLQAEVKRLTDENAKLQTEIDNFLGRNDRGPESIKAGKFATQDNEKDE